MSAASTYEQLCAEHEWHVPERYNIAADVCDKHPRDKPAMVWERYDGATRELDWGELQDLANQAAHLLARRTGSARATGSRSSCRRPPRPPRSSSAPGSSARSCSRCRCSTATRGSATGSATRRRRCWSPTPPTPAASTLARRRAPGPRRRACSTGAADRPRSARTPPPTTRPSSTTRRARPGMAKGIVHAHRYILAHEEFVYCHDVQRRRALPRHGRVGLGGRDRAAARAVAARRASSTSTSARAASTRHKQLDFLSRHEVTNVFTTPTAMRSMMAIADAGERYPQQFRDRLLAPASRSTRRRSAGSASSTGSPCSTTTG